MRLGNPLRSIAKAGWSAPTFPVNLPLVPRWLPTVKSRVLVGVSAAVVVTTGSTLELLQASDVDPLGLVMVVLTLTAPLAVVLLAPLLTWRVMTVSLFASTLLVPAASNVWPWPLTGFVAYLLVTLLVALTIERSALFGVAFLGCALPVLPAGPQDRMHNGVVFLIFAVVILAVSVGGLVRETALTRRALDDEIERGEAELVRATALAERARLARELHDVVAHHMSLIAIQSDVAPRAIADLPPEAVEAFGTIRTSSTTALAEMRRIVDTLREADAGAERAPLPTLDDLPALIEAVRATGTGVTYDGDAHLGVPPAPVAVSVYRIAQEALANAVQHAPGAAVQVALKRDGGDLVLTVRNGPVARVESRAGAGRSPAAAAPSPSPAPSPSLAPSPAPSPSIAPSLALAPAPSPSLAPSPATMAAAAATPSAVPPAVPTAVPTATPPAARPTDRPRRGLGLVGMRERAHLLGGEVVSGPTPTGGFEVIATIPIAVGHIREKENR